LTQAPERPRRQFAAIDDVTAALRDAGHRVSSPMRIVLEALFATDAPVSAAEIAAGLGGRVPPLDPSSVYRNLERLQDLGVVTHVHVAHGAGLYALARGPEREYLVCESCGRVTALDPEALDDVRDRLRELSGFTVRFDHFPIHGLCRDCGAARSDPV
jgi:Fur family transcriptional regulator, ferric uptake regulator